MYLELSVIMMIVIVIWNWWLVPQFVSWRPTLGTDRLIARVKCARHTNPSLLQAANDTMAANDTTTALPNPFTPMAFVPPSIASNMQHETYAFIGSLAVGLTLARFLRYPIIYWLIKRQVLLWDIFLHSAQDYRVAIQFGINFSFMLYVISRWVHGPFLRVRTDRGPRVTCLAYLLGVVIVSSSSTSLVQPESNLRAC